MLASRIPRIIAVLGVLMCSGFDTHPPRSNPQGSTLLRFTVR